VPASILFYIPLVHHCNLARTSTKRCVHTVGQYNAKHNADVDANVDCFLLHNIGIQPRLPAPPLPRLIINKHAVLLFRPFAHITPQAFVRFIQTSLYFIDERHHHSTVCIHLQYSTILADVVFRENSPSNQKIRVKISGKMLFLSDPYVVAYQSSTQASMAMISPRNASTMLRPQLIAKPRRRPLLS
jgi:hypothetical protein